MVTSSLDQVERALKVGDIHVELHADITSIQKPLLKLCGLELEYMYIWEKTKHEISERTGEISE